MENVIVIGLLIVGVGLMLLGERLRDRRLARRRQYEGAAPQGGERHITHRPAAAPSRRAAPPRPAVEPARPAAAQQPPAPAPLSLRAWLNRVNQEPDRAPHLVATGPTGSGKSTLVLAALVDRPGRIVIVSPKSQKTDPWGGLPVVRLRRQDMSVADIAETIASVSQEMRRRYAHEAEVEADWLTLVIDEYPTITAEIKGLADTVLHMLRMARSARIRLILIATEVSVKAMGLEGNGAARENCLFVECADDKSAAIYRWGKPAEPIDTTQVLAIAHRSIPLHRWWSAATMPALTTPAATPRRERIQDISNDDLLGGMLVPVSRSGGQLAASGGHTGMGGMAGIPHTDADTGQNDFDTESDSHTGGIPASLTPEAIRTLHAAGWSRNKIAELLTGAKQKRLAIIGAALAEVEIEAAEQ
jgi:hypothetical protein